MNIELLYIQTENILNFMKCPFKQPPPPATKKEKKTLKCKLMYNLKNKISKTKLSTTNI